MTARDDHLSRRDAERLLEDPAASGSALGTALASASAPARPAELRGEHAAVAAFHAARLTPPPATRSSYVSPSRLGGRSATRFVVASGAALALVVGGIALANGFHLPDLPGLATDGTQKVASSSDQESTKADPRRTKPPTAKKHAPRSGQNATRGTSKGSASPGSTSQDTSPGTSTSPEGLTSVHPTPQTTQLLAEVCRGVLDKDPKDRGDQRRSHPDGDHHGDRHGDGHGDADGHHDEVLAALTDLADGRGGVMDFCVVFLGTLPPAAAEDEDGDHGVGRDGEHSGWDGDQDGDSDGDQDSDHDGDWDGDHDVGRDGDHSPWDHDGDHDHSEEGDR
ncbi:hypothetical protein J2X46_002274 [Nocardioides sp. BE266]|uniref:hypothetical protein n=1 Tax=Nocardioides sp. BE266 TaxID=2817725 RepID=UPI0028648FA4|nr:hypothetical protein [Nocardioides sp. BE266]MDR7253289.1 hypothetical protein [Nocardioides sp. BE266]